ncbi:MAG: CehA/McbA family metallohydrolase domain-containing protein [Planctomycetota bacterium]|jgi:hypothetical protein
MHKSLWPNKFYSLVLAVFLSVAFTASAQQTHTGKPQWFKGNSHTHTWWSDGMEPPEMVAEWYKNHGYNFLVISDHNTLNEGEKWIVPKNDRAEVAEVYQKTFGPHWVEKRKRNGKTEYRLKTLNEYRPLFQEAGKFLLIQGEEITDKFAGSPVHLNGINLVKLVPPQGGDSILDMMQRNIDAVLDQRNQTGQPMFAHINHPNFGRALTAEDIMRVKGTSLFEIYKDTAIQRNYDQNLHPSTERLWDIILTKRLAELGLPVMYAVATDDAHHFGVAGRGWVMVRAKYLTPVHIVKAMERGHFYATTGVILDRITFKNNTLEIDIHPQPGVSYQTRFIGTLTGYDGTGRPRTEDPHAHLTLKYSHDIGKVLSQQTGTHPRYRMTGKEIYLRAKIISSAKHPNPCYEHELQVAWIQPLKPHAVAQP